jgi:hypothetical protein
VPDDKVDEVMDLLGSDPTVHEVEVEKGRVRFVLSGDDADSARLLSRVVVAGHEVFEWRVDAAGLEELFLQITAEQVGAA